MKRIAVLRCLVFTLLPFLTPSVVQAAPIQVKIIGNTSIYNSHDATAIATELNNMLAAAPGYAGSAASASVVSGQSLIDSYYHPTYRASTRAVLDAKYDYLVILPETDFLGNFPEATFEGVLQMSRKALNAGSTPLLLMPRGNLGISLATLGANSYRIGHGAGIVTIPGGYAVDSASLTSPSGSLNLQRQAYLLAATLFTRITGINASSTSYAPSNGGTPIDVVNLANIAVSTLNTHASTSHYTTSRHLTGAVRYRNIIPPNNRVRFAWMGTSSEIGIRDALNPIITASGHLNANTQGTTSASKEWEPATFDSVKSAFTSFPNEFLFVYGRGTQIDAQPMVDYSQSNLMPMIYDRHYDDIGSGAASVNNVLNDVHDRSDWLRYYNNSYSWLSIPMHMGAARLNDLDPTIIFSTDGTHMSAPLYNMVASMMLTSSLGKDPTPTSTILANSQLLNGFNVGRQTIKELAFLSETMAFTPETNLAITSADTLSKARFESFTHTLTASGGTPPYIWSETSSVGLPAGLTLSTAGVLSGAITSVPGIRQMVFRVTDSAGAIRKIPFTLTITEGPGSLAITPTTGLTFTGYFGGPFLPATQSYTVNNPGTTSIQWTAAKTASWLTLSATSGTLASGESTTVTASIHSSANSLSAATYNDTITFTNTTNGNGNTTRGVALTVNPVYTVSYNANGADSGTVPANQTKQHDVPLTLATNSGNLTKAGFVFGGWNTSATGNGTNYSAGGNYTANAPVTLYVRWNTPPVVNAGSDQTVTLTAGTSWSPIQLSPKLWLDADDTSTITLNGATVSLWSDKSGFNRHATASGTAQPTATAAGLNGKRVITFDATTDVMNVDLDFLAGVSHSAFIVTKPTAYSNIYGAANANAGAASLHVGFASGTTYRMNYWSNDYGPAITSNFVAGAANIMNYVWTSGASKQILANGKSEGISTSPVPGTIAAMSGGGRIGRTTGHGFFGGDIAELIAITGTVSATDREKMEGYLALKWGLAANLAANHPYKNSAPGGDSASANLDGTATDPDPLTYSWTVVSGPGAVLFGNAAAIDTTAFFSVAGVYTLRLTANDGVAQVSDDVVITVNAASSGNAVVYNGNGSTGGSVPVDTNSPYANGANVTVLGNTGSLVRSGFTFAGWNTAANGTGIAYAPGNTFTINSATTLFAQWTAVPTYTINYNGNGNTGGSAPSDQIKTQGVNLTLSGAGTLVRTGFAFSNWNTLADGSGTSYAAGATYSADANLTLHAQWTALPTYTITYDGNGNTGGSAPANQTKIHDANITLAGVGDLVRTGYLFIGWNTAANGTGTNYAAASTYSGNAPLTLFANWILNNFLTWDANGATANQTDGAGAWLNANQWWNGSSNTTWPSSVNATFGNGGAGGAVTLASPTIVNQITFNNFTGTYTLGTAGQALTINGGISNTASSGGISIISPITLGGPQTWTNNSPNTLTVSGAISNGGHLLSFDGTGFISLTTPLAAGGGGITKNGTGRLQLSNLAQLYTGPTIVNGGVLSYGDNSSQLSAANITLNGGVIDQRWTTIFTRALGAGDNQIQIIGGASGFSNNNGSHTVRINNNALTEVVWGAANEAGNVNATGFFNPSTFVLQSAFTQNNTTLAFDNPIDLNASTRTIEVHPGIGGASVAAFTGVIRTSTGTAGIIKTGGGRLNLNAANTYTGGTTVNAGVLTMGNASALGSISGPLNVNAGTLNMAGNNLTVGNLTGTGGVISGTSNNRTLTIGQGDTGGGNFQGSIQDGAAGTTALTKTGTGTITLSGTNTYTGATVINAGKLFINGDQTSATGNVNVAANATLGGTGTIGGNTTIAANGRLEFNITTPAASHDKLDLASGDTLTFAGASVLTITSASGAAPGIYTLVAGGNNIIGSAPATLNLPVGWAATVSISGNSLLLNVTSIGGLDNFAISSISSPQTVGTAITGITITARNASNQTDTSFTGTVTFGGTAGITGTSANFVAGVLSGVNITPNIAGNNLTFTVTDGVSGKTGSATFTVQRAYTNWSATFPSLTNPSASLDFDNGGLPTGIEWVVGGNPSTGSDDASLTPTINTTSDPNGKLLFTYRRTTAAKNDANTVIAAQYGTILDTWTNAVHQGTGANQITITETSAGPGLETVTVALPPGLAAGGKLFVRLRVVIAGQ